MKHYRAKFKIEDNEWFSIDIFCPECGDTSCWRERFGAVQFLTVCSSCNASFVYEPRKKDDYLRGALKAAIAKRPKDPDWRW